MTAPLRWPGPDGSDGPHVFVADLEALELADQDAHHLHKALRLRDGDRLTASDGSGHWRKCRFGSALTPIGPIEFVPPHAVTLTVAFALTKGAKPELVVQKLTELGVDAVVPFVAERSVAQWDEAKAAKQKGRLARIAHEAAMQSRRVRIPRVADLSNFSDLIGDPAVRADRDGAQLDGSHTIVLVGPEGGWSPVERESMPAVSLGPHILRAETAAIAAATLMATLRSF